MTPYLSFLIKIERQVTRVIRHNSNSIVRSTRPFSSSIDGSSVGIMTALSFPSTPDLCDDFEETIRIVDPSLGFRNFGGKTRFGGQVVTVKCFEDNSRVKELSNKDGIGKVMVVDGGGSRRRALLGDQVGQNCVKTGWEGLVIYGSIRDVDEIAELNLGVQALGPSPMKTMKRNEGQTSIPIHFGGVTFKDGDCIVCDNNGIVVNDQDMRRP